MEVAGKNFSQPSIYSSRVEYIEGTGTQWINTLVSVSTKIRLELVAEVMKTYGSRPELFCLIGDNNDGSRSHGIAFYGESCIRFCSNNHTDFTEIECQYVNKKNIYVYDSIDKTCSVNDVIRELPITGESDISYGLLHYPNRPSSSFIAAKIFSCRISDENGLLFDAFPVRSKDEGCLYDNVSGKLFRNNGSGSFVCGPDCEGEV